MQPFHRMIQPGSCAAILAAATLVVPLVAQESGGAGDAAQRETDRRRIDIQEADELSGHGEAAYAKGSYGEAVEAFRGARNLIPDAPAFRDLRAAATARLVTASIEHAKNLSRKGDVAGAMAAIDAVLAPGVAPGDPAATAMRSKLEDPIRTNPAATRGQGAAVDEVRRLLYTAEGAYNLGKFDEAINLYRSVLRIDPYNTAARRGMETVDAAKTAYAKAATDSARSEMLAQVDAMWETPLPPVPIDPGTLPDAGGAEGGANALPLTAKLDSIMLPSLAMEGVSLEEAVDLLRMRSVELDTKEPDPARRGVNFNIQLGGPESPAGNAIRAIRFNMKLNSVPISQALRYITQQTKTTWSADAYAVTIRSVDSESKVLETRTFRVPPNFTTALETMAGGAPAADAEDPFSNNNAAGGAGLLTRRIGVREALAKANVTFPDGASVSLTGSQLVATNTPANLDLISTIIDSLAKDDRLMVVVRVSMIRVQENRLKELGWDWALGNLGFAGASWIPGADKLNLSGGTVGNGSPLFNMPDPLNHGPTNPITSGNRSGAGAVSIDSIDAAINAGDSHLGAAAADLRAPGVFGVTRVLDGSYNHVSTMLRGMAQKKGVDLLVQPSTIVHSGQASTVKSVKEMPYPRSYEPPELPNSTGGGDLGGGGFGGGFSGGGGNGSFPVTPSHPTDFDKREIGVTLEVTPTADPVRRLVDVTLAPSVVNFDGFINYGSPIGQAAPISLTSVLNAAPQTVVLTPNRILMPVFSTHRTNTSLKVSDGATIVIGGLLDDRITRVADNTPLLGELPFFGRFFQSKVDSPISTAVMFFVHVQIVDATGQPLSNTP